MGERLARIAEKSFAEAPFIFDDCQDEVMRQCAGLILLLRDYTDLKGTLSKLPADFYRLDTAFIRTSIRGVKINIAGFQLEVLDATGNVKSIECKTPERNEDTANPAVIAALKANSAFGGELERIRCLREIAEQKNNLTVIAFANDIILQIHHPDEGWVSFLKPQDLDTREGQDRQMELWRKYLCGQDEYVEARILVGNAACQLTDESIKTGNTRGALMTSEHFFKFRSFNYDIKNISPNPHIVLGWDWLDPRIARNITGVYGGYDVTEGKNPFHLLCLQSTMLGGGPENYLFMHAATEHLLGSRSSTTGNGLLAGKEIGGAWCDMTGSVRGYQNNVLDALDSLRGRFQYPV
jgi:hypothetical protein